MQSLRTLVPEPAVSRRSLLIGAGVAWGIGGIILIWRAFHVGADLPQSQMWVWVPGVVLGLVKYRIVFRKVSMTNITRIRELSPHKEKICLFAFQSLQAYALVIVMVGAGIGLRHLGLPAAVLIAAYVMIGLGMLLGSGVYFREAGRQAPIN